MSHLERVILACGVIVGQGADGHFAHLATAWSMGGGDWIAAWSEPEPPTAPRLLRAADGKVGELSGWECDNGIAGFTADEPPGSLEVASDATVHKRDHLWSLGFPSVIDHPAFILHHGSLDAERYLPYLCHWLIEGPLLLFSSQDGWLPGILYPGMAGGPVLRADGAVVGVLLDGAGGGEQPPLTRFRRLD